MKQLRFLLLPILLTGGALSGRACDLCGCYTPQIEAMSGMALANSRFYAAVGEQFTHFGTLQEEGRKIEASEISTHVGGGAVNAAVAMARLGFDVSTLVKLGKDARAETVLARLLSAGLGEMFNNAFVVEDVPVVFETHRTRLLYAPWTTARYCEAIPELRITADFSHFTTVAEVSKDRFDGASL